MKPSILFCVLALALPARAEPENLSALDAQLLLEKLKELREGSEERIESRFKTAHSAFRVAVQSDAAAHDLYLNCVEKVQFEDEKKKASDFRDWKRAHKERTDTSEFRRVLRHQLNWLLLTLEAASEPEKKNELWPKAVDRLEAIFADADQLKGEQARLRQSVLQSVYATAYGLNGIKVGDWPTAPLQLSPVYDQLILPPLRKKSTLAQLRQAWGKRIEHEGLMHSEWGQPSTGRGGGRGRPVSFDRFLAERRPELIWQMESDLFRVGDQKGAALRMLAHIEKYMSHDRAADWIEEFERLVKGEPEPVDSAAPASRPLGDKPDASGQPQPDS